MIIVRPAGPKDAAQAIDVVRRSLPQQRGADHCNDKKTIPAWLGNKTSKKLLGWLSNADNFCVIAESCSEVLGVGFVHRRGEIVLLYLAPAPSAKVLVD